MPPIRFALALPPTQVDWDDYLAAVKAADEMAYETFWGFDHLMPISGDMDGPNFECYTTMAALAAATKRIRVGALVTGVAYRNPALQIKEATQVDVISGAPMSAIRRWRADVRGADFAGARQFLTRRGAGD